MAISFLIYCWLVDGDVVALDDTLVVHEHAIKMPFLYRLFDHCSNTYVQAINLVVIHAMKANGLQYPLLYSIWKKDNGQGQHLSKLDLALIMLKELKKQVPEALRICVAMDSWYFAKGFCQWYSGCVFPASSGQCAIALTLKPVTSVMGGSYTSYNVDLTNSYD